MKTLTDKEISEAASSFFFKRYSGFINEQIELDRGRRRDIDAFEKGAKFAVEYLKPAWRPIHELPNDANEHTTLIKFDNGEVRRYSEKWPFAEAIGFIEINF